MGNTNSIYDYKRALDTVASKTKWRIGLVVNVGGGKLFIVDQITPIIEQLPTSLRKIDDRYIYQYIGDSVVIDPVEATHKYLIHLKDVGVGKIGGRQRGITSRLHGGSSTAEEESDDNIQTASSFGVPDDLIDLHIESAINPDLTAKSEQ